MAERHMSRCARANRRWDTDREVIRLMQSGLLIRLLLLPGMLMQRGPRAYLAGSLAASAAGLMAAAVWLMAPVAIWHTFGHWWMLLWLLPTAAVIYATALTPMPGGG